MANSERGSATWNFLWDCRSIITEHISWHVGNDRMTKFWRDSWEGEPALMELINNHDWIESMENTWGQFVGDYFDTAKEKDGKRAWKQFTNGCLILCNQTNKILKGRVIPISLEEDKIFWCAAKSCAYSVKLGYEVQRNKNSNPEWPYKLCWDKKLQPKAGAFLWIALHNIILTGDRLKMVGIEGPNMCIMCRTQEETANHLLYNCPYAETYWNWFFENTNFKCVRNEQLYNFLTARPIKHNSKWSDL